MNERFRLRAEEIAPLATGRGACIASNMITQDGRAVAFMYRQAATDAGDSGWVFLSGHESDAYMNDPANLALYDVNTIANYDRDIIPFLDAPIGAAFEREGGAGPLARVWDWIPPEDE